MIELLIALLLLTVAILGMFSMQLHAIKGNSTAMTITNESNWASDRVEKIIATDYSSLNDGNASSPDGKYLISWSVNATTPNMKKVTVDVKNTITSSTVSYSITKIKLY